MITIEELKKWREVCDAATEVEYWKTEIHEGMTSSHYFSGPIVSTEDQADKDAEFAELAREIVPKLIDEVGRLRDASRNLQIWIFHSGACDEMTGGEFSGHMLKCGFLEEDFKK